MKVKNVLFVTIFLAAAGLGLAHPPKHSTDAHPPQSDGTTKTDGLSQVQAKLADVSGKISSKCSTAIFSIATSPEFSKCVPLKALVPILPILTNPSTLQDVLKDPKNYPTLVEKPLNQFATELCAAPKCSDDGVNAAAKALQDGCKDDFKTNELVRLLRYVTVFYSPLRDITCFKDKGKFCFDQTALTLTKLPPSPIKLSGNKFLDSVAVADPTAICTKCNKKMVNTYFNFLKDKKDKKDSLPFDILKTYGIDDKEIDGARIGAIVKCGLHFVDGSTS